MDQESQKRFDTLRQTDLAAWTEADKDFMKARRAYLHADEVKAFGLESEPASEPEPPKKADKPKKNEP